MYKHLSFRFIASVLMIFSIAQLASAQNSAFTYQGKLNDNGAPANGIYDLRFAIYDAVTNGNLIAGPTPYSSVAISNGLFTTQLDFGNAPFNGNARWLEVAARTNGAPDWTTLSPLQSLASTPYAIQSANAATAVTATIAGSANSVAGTNITGTILDAQLSTNVALFNANATFSGTLTASQLLDGDSLTSIIAWGTGVPTELLTVPSGLTNVIAVAAGREHNLALKSNGTVVAWGSPSIEGTLPASWTNVTAIAAGIAHSLALRSDGTVAAWGTGFTGHGQINVPSGLTNVVAIAAGHNHSLALRSNGTVAAWGINTFGQVNVPANLTNVTAIAAGDRQSLALRNDGTVVAWGQATVPSGLTNVIAIAAGSTFNLALKSNGTVTAWGTGATNVPPGLGNVIAISVGQGHGLALKNDGKVIAWGANYVAVPPGLSDVVAIAAGSAAPHALVIRHGPSTIPLLQGANSFIGANSFYGSATFYGAHTVAGNSVVNGNNTVSGNNVVDGDNIVNGLSQLLGPLHVSGDAQFDGNNVFHGKMVMYQMDTNNAPFLVSGGSHNNIVLQAFAPAWETGLQTISFNGYHDFPLAPAGGFYDHFFNPDKSVWHISVDQRSSNDVFKIQANTGSVIRSLTLDTSGNLTVSGTINGTSDRAAKENFTPLDAREVLEKVATLPITSWNYKGDPQTRHFGPVSQDFHAAFGVGSDDRHISMVDADGVALAAVQGLNQKLNEQLKRRDTENAELRRQNESLEKRLEALEKIVLQRSGKR